MLKESMHKVLHDNYPISSFQEWHKRYGSRQRNLVNLFDSGLKGLSIVQSECICGGRNFRMPKRVAYIHFMENWKGITIFTDKHIYRKSTQRAKSLINVAMLTEPRELSPGMYSAIEDSAHLFDLILTHDAVLLEKFPEKSRFFIASCPIVGYSDIRLHPKSKLCSMTFSNKTMISGHNFRHEIYKGLTEENKKKVDFFGSGAGNYTPEKIETLRDYMFSIVVENNKTDYYFTEKIFDCFATGNVPIFWGCPKIGDFFDVKGILMFNSVDDLNAIIKNLSPEKYVSMKKEIEHNFLLSHDFEDPDDIAFFTILDFLKTKRPDLYVKIEHDLLPV